MTTALTNEQLELYLAIVNEEERGRALSQEEKEDLIIRIFSHPFIDLMCDWAFKHVFGHNEDRLLLLLNDILPEKIVHITFEPNEIDRWKGDDKNVIMDVLCHADDGRKFIVEMQRSDKEYFRSRIVVLWSFNASCAALCGRYLWEIDACIRYLLHEFPVISCRRPADLSV